MAAGDVLDGGGGWRIGGRGVRIARLRALAWAIGAALLLHAVLLGGVDWGHSAPQRVGVPAVQVRVVASAGAPGTSSPANALPEHRADTGARGSETARRDAGRGDDSADDSGPTTARALLQARSQSPAGSKVRGSSAAAATTNTSAVTSANTSAVTGPHTSTVSRFGRLPSPRASADPPGTRAEHWDASAKAATPGDLDVAAAAAPATRPSGPAAVEPSLAPGPRLDAEAAQATAVAGTQPVPPYKTRFPPPARLLFSVLRGGVEGHGELQWRPTGGDYLLRFQASAAGAPWLAQASAGSFNAEGLAPERFTERRTPGGLRATNFQRDAGTISFSGSPATFALQPGSQDRLSWMLQLAAVLAAEPQRLAAGSRVVLTVAGLRNEPAAWEFRSVGEEPATTPAGTLAAVKLERAGSGAYDSRIEVWVDPAQHCLPVRIRFDNGVASQVLEWQLQLLAVDA